MAVRGNSTSGSGLDHAIDVRRVVDASRSATVVVDLDGTVIFASAAVETLFGITAREANGASIVEWLHPDDVERAINSLAANQTHIGIRYFPMVFRIRHVDGHFVEVDVLISNLLTDPVVRGVVLCIRSAQDRTQYIEPVRALAAGADHATVLRLIALGVGRGGHSQRPAFIAADRDVDSRRFLAVHAVRADDRLVKLIVSYLDSVTAAESFGSATEPLRSVASAELPNDLAKHVTQLGCAGLRSGAIAVGGEIVALLVSVEPAETWQDGSWTPSTTDHWLQLLDLACVAFERHASQTRLVHAATHDSLTGIANRGHFFERLARLARRSAIAVMYLDLDHFKDVNDQFGHARGDDVLTEVARRLRLTVRPGDLIGRLGGDEFAVAITDAGRDVVAELAQRLLDAVSAPMPKRFRVDRVTASIGFAIVGRGANIDELVHRADTAMLLVKRSGRRNIVGEG